MTQTEKLMLRRKRRRIKRIKRFFIALFFIIILSGTVWAAVLSVKTFKKNVTVKPETIPIPDYVDINIIDNPNARSRRPLKKINSIVIHYTGNPNSTAKNNRDYFNKPTTTVSSHFVVGLDGEVIECLPLNEVSKASNNRNKDTISIEVCHPDQSGKFTDEAYNSIVSLTAWLCKYCKLDEDDVIRHYDVTGKQCPKYYVENENEWEKLKKDISVKILEYRK